jgi:hypothetical protein
MKNKSFLVGTLILVAFLTLTSCNSRYGARRKPKGCGCPGGFGMQHHPKQTTDWSQQTACANNQNNQPAINK